MQGHRESLASLFSPQTALGSDRQLWVPLLLRNGPRVTDVTLTSSLPPGWKQFTGPGIYHLEPGETYPVQVFLVAPFVSNGKAPPQMLQWTASSGGSSVGEITLSVYPEFDGVPQ